MKFFEFKHQFFRITIHYPY